MPPKRPPLLNAAPDWKPDLSESVILWHGCTMVAKNSIEASGIDLTRCAVDTDFGRGFYTTTLKRQARLWAWDQFYQWQAAHPSGTGNQPVVLQFRVRRYTRTPWGSELDDGLDKLASLGFVRGDYDSEDYWSLVQHCRQSTPADPATGTPEVVHDHKRPTAGWYEMVCGPVAAFWRQRVTMTGADQFSFHTGGTDLLDALVRAGKGKGRGGQGDSKYYRWSVVV
ncbi:MAG TPA: hypothetical protein VFG68_17485 [Fimbriiglobus sp.]|nr:hypothetical protein [Fimbriiglobus sp.]